MTRALLLAAAVLLAPAAALAAADSLVLQPSTPSAAPGGTIDVQVLVRIHPDGKAVIPARASDVALTAKGGGTVAPASEAPGETKWVYTAPAAVAADLVVTLEARVRSYPEASGSCTVQVKAPAAPKPPAPVPAADAEDEEGDLLDGAEAVAADPVGKLVTLERWRARADAGEEWNERKIPPRGEDLYAPGRIHDFRFRVNAADVESVEVQWWRNDRTKKVRTFTERNKRIEVDRDQDGFLHVRFDKSLGKEKGAYTFAVVARKKDGTTLRENLVVHRARPPKEEEEKGKGKGGGR